MPNDQLSIRRRSPSKKSPQAIPFIVSSELTSLELGYCLSQGVVERILTQRGHGTSVKYCMDLGAQILDEQGDTAILQAISTNLSIHG